ncbi:hypothetical protein EDB85DRAFT_1896313 [Lactarius pseudohatsudake]|nr:hypothetical protein EDB85DRAFT_1896313 [Lactarius pseudohatsudake]
MSHLGTRATNKDKHPGVVDLGPQRRTHEQKKADNEKTAEDKQAREETRKAGIRKLTGVEERDRQRLNTLMGPSPRPRPRPVTGSNMAATTRMGTGAEKTGLPVPTDKAIQEAIPADQRVGGDNAVNTGSNINEEEKQGKVKKTRVERAMYHKEVEAEKTQGQSVAGNKDDNVSNEKDGISGPHTVRRVQLWMSTIQAPSQPLQTREGLGNSQSHVMIANTEFTTSSGCQTEPMFSSDDGLRYRISSEPNEVLVGTWFCCRCLSSPHRVALLHCCLGLRLLVLWGGGCWGGGGWAGVVTWHAGLHVAVVSGRVESRGVLRAAGWRGGGAARRVAGLRSWCRWRCVRAGHSHSGVLVEVEGDGAMSLGVARRRGSRSGDVVCERRYGKKKRKRKKHTSEAKLVVVSWGLACRDGMASERGICAAGYWWRLRETGP